VDRNAGFIAVKRGHTVRNRGGQLGKRQ